MSNKASDHSKTFLKAQEKLKTYELRGTLEAQPRSDGYWLFDYWRDSTSEQWQTTTIAENLTKDEVSALGAFIHPCHQ